MSSPISQIINLGQALTEVLSMKVQEGAVEALSELEKLKAEQSERLRQFIAEVEERANQKDRVTTEPTQIIITDSETDLQELLDELRSEIARLRSELKYWTEVNRLRNPL